MAEHENRSNELPGAFSLFGPSWKAVSLNLVTFIELVLVPVLFITAGQLIKHVSGHTITVFGEILSIVLAPSVYLTQLTSAKNKNIDFTEAIRKSFHYFWRFLGLAICVGILVTIGFILFIVPGLFMLRRYILSPYYLLDRDMKIFDAMKASAADSKEFSEAVWGLIGVIALLAIGSAIVSILLGALTIIGLVFYYIYYCAPAIRYLQIKHATKPSSVVAPIV